MASNQPALATLLIPIIPPDVCFTGTTTDILNQNNQQYLAAATVDIPRFADFNPATITQIQEQQQIQQDEIDALNPLIKTANVPLATGDQTVSIVFSTPMPDVNYYIVVNINDAAGAGTTNVGWSIVSGTKTTAGINLRFYDIAASEADFDYFAVHYPQF